VDTILLLVTSDIQSDVNFISKIWKVVPFKVRILRVRSSRTATASSDQNRNPLLNSTATRRCKWSWRSFHMDWSTGLLKLHSKITTHVWKLAAGTSSTHNHSSANCLLCALNDDVFLHRIIVRFSFCKHSVNVRKMTTGMWFQKKNPITLS